jgi:hypothetical protein
MISSVPRKTIPEVNQGGANILAEKPLVRAINS